MPPFVEEMLMWTRRSAVHMTTMFWWIFLGAFLVTALSEAFWVKGARARLLASPDRSWKTIWSAAMLGILSPPSRRRIFRQAKELLASGVSPAGVLAYLVAGQALLLWMLFFIVELNGPQPMLGQILAVTVALATLLWGARRIPPSLWEEAKERARREGPPARGEPPIGQAGPAPLRLGKSLAFQVSSLWWPLIYGLAGIGFFLALGQSPGYLSLQGSKEPLVQAGNAVVGGLLGYVTGAPLIGNALFAASLWKAQSVTYAGLSAFYLGTLVMPFVLPRYFALFGPELGKRVVTWLVAGILLGALAATAWWWGLDGLAGLVGLREPFETLTASTLRPNDVPWFHHWFAPGL